MTIKCAIIDDEPLALGLIAGYVKKTPTLELCGTYSSAVQAMKMLPDNPVDLLFLDIQMPELNGLEFSKMVPEKTRIVFTTAFEQYAIDGYRANALDYLLNSEAVGRAIEWFNLKLKAEGEKTPNTDGNPNYIYVKSDYKLIQVELDKILYIEGLKDYVKIYTEDNPRPILSLISMKALEERLPAERFLRVHRSFIVQKQKIKIIDKGRIVFGKEYIPISETYKTMLQDYVNKHTI